GLDGPRPAGHLLEQLHQEILDPHLLPIGEWIIENLDERGFLDKDCLVIALHLGAENAEVMDVLDRIHHFDPVGTAARDSQECLLIQARAYFPVGSISRDSSRNISLPSRSAAIRPLPVVSVFLFRT